MESKKEYVCLGTGCQFRGGWKRLWSHVFKVHKALQDAPYYCTLCLFKCEDKVALDKHVSTYKAHMSRAKPLKTGSEEVDMSVYLHKSASPYKLKEGVDFRLREETATMPTYTPTPLAELKKRKRREAERESVKKRQCKTRDDSKVVKSCDESSLEQVAAEKTVQEAPLDLSVVKSDDFLTEWIEELTAGIHQKDEEVKLDKHQDVQQEILAELKGMRKDLQENNSFLRQFLKREC